MANRTGVILAAGQGSRMKSLLPKPLVSFAGKPMVQWVYEALESCCDEIIIVIQSQHLSSFSEVLPNAKYIVQAQQQGTANALQQAIGAVSNEDMLVMCADSPCVDQDMLQNLCSQGPLGVIAFKTDDPRAYGRVLEDKIIESHQDASIATDVPCNSGIYRLQRSFIEPFLKNLTQDVSGEYLLTDWVACAINDQRQVEIVLAEEWRCTGVNTMHQKVLLERIYDLKRVEALMMMGVDVQRPESITIRGSLNIGKSVTIESNCLFEGQVVLEDGVVIEQGCIIRNSKVGKKTRIKAYSTVDGSDLDHDITIGPYAHIQQSEIASGSYLGNFAECKRTQVGEAVKAKHMCYLGDGRIDKQVNIGAGTVFCNYDGVNKSITTIGLGAFVGANTSLIAPVVVGHYSKVGAGSVVNRDIPNYCLYLRRPKDFFQRQIDPHHSE